MNGHPAALETNTSITNTLHAVLSATLSTMTFIFYPTNLENNSLSPFCSNAKVGMRVCLRALCDTTHFLSHFLLSIHYGPVNSPQSHSITYGFPSY